MNKDKKNKKNVDHLSDNIVLDIPEDEIWTYQVEGLPAPAIGKTPKNYLLKKIIFTVTIVIAVAISIALSGLKLAKITLSLSLILLSVDAI